MGFEVIKSLLSKPSKTYDASKNKFYVADYLLDGVVSAKKNVDNAMTVVKGVDPRYYAAVKQITNATFEVEILPTARCIEPLRKLYFQSISTDGYFDIIISDNIGDSISYKAHFLSFFDESYKKEADNKTITFGLIENF